MTYKRILPMLCCLIATVVSQASEEQRDAILSQITGAQMPKTVINIQKMGAKGNGTSDCLPAFRKAFKKAAKLGGARIVVPTGTYYIKGPLHLVSNVCLEIQEGATLKFAPEPEYYLPAVKTSWEGTFVQNYSPFIYGYQLHDISIIGKGTIDGNAMTTFATWRNKQKAAGIDYIPSNDFSFYDNMLDTAFLLNAVPARYTKLGLSELETYFAAAHGYRLCC